MKFAILILLSVLFLFQGCKTRCTSAEKLSGSIAPKISKTFDCKNEDEIKKDVKKFVLDWGICDKEFASGTAAIIICEPIADAIAKEFVEKALPKKWECSGGMGQSTIKGVVYAACTAAIPF